MFEHIGHPQTSVIRKLVDNLQTTFPTSAPVLGMVLLLSSAPGSQLGIAWYCRLYCHNKSKA